MLKIDLRRLFQIMVLEDPYKEKKTSYPCLCILTQAMNWREAPTRILMHFAVTFNLNNKSFCPC